MKYLKFKLPDKDSSSEFKLGGQNTPIGDKLDSGVRGEIKSGEQFESISGEIVSSISASKMKLPALMDKWLENRQRLVMGTPIALKEGAKKLREYKIVIEPFNLTAIHDIHIERSINKHTSVKLKGYIAPELSNEYFSLVSQHEYPPISIKLCDEDGNKTVFFKGFITHFSESHVGGLLTVTIEAMSHSFRMDLQPHYRTFQDLSLTYSGILNYFNSTYPGSSCLMKLDDFEIGHFAAQYHETDWAFLTRIFSERNSFLVPGDTYSDIRYYVGMPEVNTFVIDEAVDYSIKKAFAATSERSEALPYYFYQNILSYEVITRDFYKLGDRIIFQGKELFVYGISSKFNGQEMVHTYQLRDHTGFYTQKQYNARHIGASLDATVLEVQRDRVLVRVLNDENAEGSINHWFPYSTVYSSPDGTGWYAMPEPGDRVQIYIPDRDENSAFVSSSVHLEASNTSRSNPDIKSMKNKYGKEIRFTPDSLIMTNNNGLEISLVDGEGIFIESSQNISISADGDIDMSSDGASLTMMGSDEVAITQGGTAMVMNDNISFQGGKLRIQ